MIKCEVRSDCGSGTCCIMCLRRRNCRLRCESPFPDQCGHSSVNEDIPLSRLIDLALIMWGTKSQIEMAVEECAELILAAKHVDRNRASIEDFMREVVDVELLMEQMKAMFDNPERYAELREEKISKFRAHVVKSWAKRVKIPLDK
jgi:hypothetical protein